MKNWKEIRKQKCWSGRREKKKTTEKTNSKQNKSNIWMNCSLRFLCALKYLGAFHEYQEHLDNLTLASSSSWICDKHKQSYREFFCYWCFDIATRRVLSSAQCTTEKRKRVPQTGFKLACFPSQLDTVIFENELAFENQLKRIFL